MRLVRRLVIALLLVCVALGIRHSQWASDHCRGEIAEFMERNDLFRATELGQFHTAAIMRLCRASCWLPADKPARCVPAFRSDALCDPSRGDDRYCRYHPELGQWEDVNGRPPHKMFSAAGWQ